MTSNKDLETKVADLRKNIEDKIGECAYLRFHTNEGHIVVDAKKAEKFKDFKDFSLEFDNNIFKIEEMSV